LARFFFTVAVPGTGLPETMPNEREAVLFLDFQSHNLVTVEMRDQGLWRIVARSEDNIFAVQLTLDVKLPALDIRHAVIEVTRDELGLVPDLSAATEKLVGVRVGPGMTKIVRGVLGGPKGSDRIADLTLEAMEMLVNGLTLPELRRAVESVGIDWKHDDDGPKVFLNNRVVGPEGVQVMGTNPRLKDSCIAFMDA
jgi:hypothetical protein